MMYSVVTTVLTDAMSLIVNVTRMDWNKKKVNFHFDYFKNDFELIIAIIFPRYLRGKRKTRKNQKLFVGELKFLIIFYFV